MKIKLERMLKMTKKTIKNDDILKKTISECKINHSMYFALDNRHQFLKEVQDSVGKGAIYMDADSDDFD